MVTVSVSTSFPVIILQEKLLKQRWKYVMPDNDTLLKFLGCYNPKYWVLVCKNPIFGYQFLGICTFWVVPTQYRWVIPEPNEIGWQLPKLLGCNNPKLWVIPEPNEIGWQLPKLLGCNNPNYWVTDTQKFGFGHYPKFGLLQPKMLGNWYPSILGYDITQR